MDWSIKSFGLNTHLFELGMSNNCVYYACDMPFLITVL